MSKGTCLHLFFGGRTQWREAFQEPKAKQNNAGETARFAMCLAVSAIIWFCLATSSTEAVAAARRTANTWHDTSEAGMESPLISRAMPMPGDQNCGNTLGRAPGRCTLPVEVGAGRANRFTCSALDALFTV